MSKSCHSLMDCIKKRWQHFLCVVRDGSSTVRWWREGISPKPAARWGCENGLWSIKRECMAILCQQECQQPAYSACHVPCRRHSQNTLQEFPRSLSNASKMSLLGLTPTSLISEFYLLFDFVCVSGLVNNTNIDWFSPWPLQALHAVAKSFLGMC